MTSPDARTQLEERLTRALADTAARNATDHPPVTIAADLTPRWREDRRRRWAVPLLAAAVVVAALTATVTAINQLDSTRPMPHGDLGQVEPTPAPTSRNLVLPWRQATPSPRTRPSPQQTQLSGPTTMITVHGVRLTVPLGWTLTDDGTDANTQACISATHSKLNCVLTVAEPLALPGNIFRPNGADGRDAGASFCGSAAGVAKTLTTQASETSIDGQLALYKRYSSPCLPGPAEQWVIPTSPGLAFFHHLTGTAIDGIAEIVVHNASLPGTGTGAWLGDDGVITAVTGSSPALNITLHRLVPLAQGGFQDTGQDVSYRLSPTVLITGDTTDHSTLSTSQLQQLARGDQPANVVQPLTVTPAEITTDGTAVTEIHLDSSHTYQPAPTHTAALGLVPGPYGFPVPAGWHEQPLTNSGGPASFAAFTANASPATASRAQPDSILYEVNGGSSATVYNSDGTPNLAGAARQARCALTSWNRVSANSLTFACAPTAGETPMGIIVIDPKPGGTRQLLVTSQPADQAAANAILDSFH